MVHFEGREFEPWAWARGGTSGFVLFVCYRCLFPSRSTLEISVLSNAVK